ncbi:hypothetical protein KIPB_011493, partial [Kipferlia bialata]
TRVSYDIVGLAPARARILESLSPVGEVSVCFTCYQILRDWYPNIQFGAVVTKDTSHSQAVDSYLDTAQHALDSAYDRVTDSERQRERDAYRSAREGLDRVKGLDGLGRDTGYRPFSRHMPNPMHMHIHMHFADSAGTSAADTSVAAYGGVVYLS